MTPFQKELESLINRHSMENGSDTPDFILAGFLTDCLWAFNKAQFARERWYGRGEIGVGPAEHESLGATRDD